MDRYETYPLVAGATGEPFYHNVYYNPHGYLSNIDSSQASIAPPLLLSVFMDEGIVWDCGSWASGQCKACHPGISHTDYRLYISKKYFHPDGIAPSEPS